MDLIVMRSFAGCKPVGSFDSITASTAGGALSPMKRDWLTTLFPIIVIILATLVLFYSVVVRSGFFR
jgi:hypothetical protein